MITARCTEWRKTRHPPATRPPPSSLRTNVQTPDLPDDLRTELEYARSHGARVVDAAFVLTRKMLDRAGGDSLLAIPLLTSQIIRFIDHIGDRAIVANMLAETLIRLVETEKTGGTKLPETPPAEKPRGNLPPTKAATPAADAQVDQIRASTRDIIKQMRETVIRYRNEGISDNDIFLRLNAIAIGWLHFAKPEDVSKIIAQLMLETKEGRPQ